MSELLNGLRTNCSNPDWITVELRRTVTGYLYEIFCSAKSEEKSLVNIKVARLFVFQEANWLA